MLLICERVLVSGSGGCSMNILFKRTQKSASIFQLVPLKIGSGVTFSLHAELELDAEEDGLIKKYKLVKAAIVISDFIEDVRRAIGPALIVSFFVFVISFFLIGFWAAVSISLLVFPIMTIIYYRALRESITVADLLNGGRTWRCDSVAELIQKEAFLEGVAGYLRQLLESAKNWDDREVIPIKPLPKAEAKLAVLKMLHG